MEPRRRLSMLIAGALLACLFSSNSSSANFRVTDERTGASFIATDYLDSPYECAAPCAFAFEALPGCQGQPYFVWGVRDGAGQTFVNAGGRSWRYEFASLGEFSVWETESTATCGTGGTFRLRVLDKSPPDTSITRGPSAVTEDRSPSFEFAASEPGATFVCRFDGAAFAPCTSPATASPLADGEHAFEVQATDAAGNADPTPATFVFQVADRTAPTLDLVTPSSQSLRRSIRRGVALTVTTNEAGRIAVRLLVDRPTARRLGLNRHARRSMVIGALAREVGVGKTVLKGELTRKARTALEHVTRLELKVVAKLTDPAGNVQTETLRLTITR